MKKVLALLLSGVITASVFAGCSSSPSESSSSAAADTSATEQTEPQTTVQPLAESVKKQLDEALSKEAFKGVTQIVRGDTVIYQYTDGSDDNGQPMTIDASLPIGSVSKQFCAAAVMLLCDRDKLSVDDKLDKYYSDYKSGNKITIKNMLNMSSGIPDYYEMFMDGSKLGADEAENIKKIKEMLFAEELNFEPGDDYGYSNSNYLLLADIVEQVSGTPYHEFIRKNIFEPLEMTHTGFVEDIKDSPEWASSLSKTELMTETSCPGLTKGAGDIVINAADMDKWMHGLSGGKVISSESYKKMTEDVNENSYEDYCYGLYKMSYDGVGHVGQIPPHFGAVDYFSTEQGIYLFAASNDPRGSSFVQQLPQTLLDILMGNTNS